MFELGFSIFGVLSAFLVMIPSIYRIYKRKSSMDFSLESVIIGLICQSVWVGYAIHLDLVGLKIACVAWVILITVQLVLILKYRKI